MSIEFKVVGIKPVSTNDMYMPRTKRTKKNRFVAISIKTNEYREFENLMKEQLGSQLDKDTLADFHSKMEDFRNEVTMELYLKMPLKNYYKSDSSNYFKTIEDCVKNSTKIDDSRNTTVISHKVINEDNPDEWEFDISLKVTRNESEMLEDKWNN